MRTKFMLLAMALGIPLAASTQLASAVGVVSQSRITIVDVRADGTFLITFGANVAGSASCVSANNLNRMTGNANMVGGKIILAAALAAYSNGTPVLYVEGSGSCTQVPGIESIVILKLGQ